MSDSRTEYYGLPAGGFFLPVLNNAIIQDLFVHDSRNGIHVEVTDRLADICQFATDADVDEEGPRQDQVPRVNQLFKGDLVGDVSYHATETLLVPSVRLGRQTPTLHVRVHFCSQVQGPH